LEAYASGHLWPSWRKAVPKKLNAGVIGVGTMGKRHAENLRRPIPEAKLVAVRDTDLTRAQEVATELEIEYF
jgi:predicted dehydrogenase